MPRNGSGTYTLPSGNPVVSGTLIQSTWANPTMADIAAELTNSLARNGAGGMTGPLQLSNGSAATPALSFSSETTMGLYRIGAAQLGISVAGTLRVSLSTSLLNVTVPGDFDSTLNADGDFTVNTNKFIVTAASGNTVIAGTVVGVSFAPTGSGIPANVIYLPSANTLGFAANSTARGSSSSTGAWVINDPTGGVIPLLVNGGHIKAKGVSAGTAAAISLENNGASRRWRWVNGVGSESDGTLALYEDIGGRQILSILPAGNVSFDAPSSGIPVSITSNGSADAIQLLDGAGRDFRVSYAIGGVAIVGAISNTEVRLYTNNTSRISILGAGNVTVNAPASGVGLTVAAVAGTHSTKIADSANTSFNAGYLEVPQNAQNVNYTTVLSDSAKQIYHSSGSPHTHTIDSNANVPYPIGTTLTFVNENGAAALSIAITTDTLRFIPAGTTGTRTLAANGRAVALKTTATNWQISGTNLT